MKASVFTALIGLFCLSGWALSKEVSPKVQVYSRTPGEVGKPNILICHTSGFHPPEITIDLLRNGKVIPNTVQTDLAFEENWHYHLTKHVPFTPSNGEELSCRVTHMGTTKTYMWESDF